MISPALPQVQWRSLAGHVSRWTGLEFLPGRLRDLERGVAAAVPELRAIWEPGGPQDAPVDAAALAACVARLLSDPPSPAVIRALSSHLTVGETYFFRDPKVIDTLTTHVLLPLVSPPQGPGRVPRIWSAGCCTGEEAYTLAIVLHQLAPSRTAFAQHRILATDINPVFLERARAGVYGPWSFRGDPRRLRHGWFRPAGPNRQAVVDPIREMVRFECHNLAGDEGLPLAAADSMDLIVCRNVLMYLSPAATERAVRRLRTALAPGGWLVASPSESNDALFPEFEPVSLDGVRLYRKPPDGARRPPVSVVARMMDGPERHAPAAVPAMPERERAHATRTRIPVRAEVRTQVRTQAHASEESPARSPAPEPSVLARRLADHGRLPEALKACEAWTSQEPLSAAAHYVHAMVLIEQGRADEGADAMRRALFLDPDFAMAHLALGRIARAAGRRAESERHFANARMALRAAPPDAPVAEGDGLRADQVLALLGELTQAEAPA